MSKPTPAPNPTDRAKNGTKRSLAVAPAGIAPWSAPSSEAEVTAAMVDGLSSFRTASGGYEHEDEFCRLIAPE